MVVTAIPFYQGLLSVIVLFVVCFIFVVFLRAVYLAFKKSPAEKPSKPRKKKQKPTPSQATRTIEIDPEGIDKIYVKKVS